MEAPLCQALKSAKTLENLKALDPFSPKTNDNPPSNVPRLSWPDAASSDPFFWFRSSGQGVKPILRGSWDLVTRVIIKVTTLICTYNPN